MKPLVRNVRRRGWKNRSLHSALAQPEGGRLQDLAGAVPAAAAGIPVDLVLAR